MFALSLPSFEANIKNIDNQTQIFDILRHRFVTLTPEEWVRQHFIHFLIDHKGYPASRLANEISIQLNSMKRRCDSVLYANNGSPLMIIEYKAPTVKITQTVFSQIMAYNNVLLVPYLIVSNGIDHYCCHIDYTSRQTNFLKEIPDYKEIQSGHEL